MLNTTPLPKFIRIPRTTIPSFFKVYDIELHERYWVLSFLLADDDWSKEETDYLFSLAREYDLRFIVMSDRYDFPGGRPRNIEVSHHKFPMELPK